MSLMPKLDRSTIRFRTLAWRDSTPAWKRWLLWRVLGRDYCPYCERVVRWTWRGLGVHEDGPPLFAEWVCVECGTGTGLEPTGPMVKALESPHPLAHWTQQPPAVTGPVNEPESVAPADPCAVPPPVARVPNVYVLHESATATTVCTNCTTAADAALALERLRGTPKGWCWCADARPGQLPGEPCPTRDGFRHLAFQLTPIPEAIRP